MKIFSIAILLIISISVNAQNSAIKTKMVCFKDPNHNFHEELTETGKKLFDLLFKVVEIDTTNSTILKMDDLLLYTSREYLSKKNYEYITLYKNGDEFVVKKYVNNVGAPIIVGDKQKIMLRYSKSHQNDLDKIVLHIIQ
jgi:hypothetical protein